jgi:multiple sugar transport system permease protein
MAAKVERGRLTPGGWAALLFGALIMLAPLLWTLLLSLKHNAELVGHSGAALHPP